MTTNREMRAIRHVTQYVRTVGVKSLIGDFAKPPTSSTAQEFYLKRYGVRIRED